MLILDKMNTKSKLVFGPGSTKMSLIISLQGPRPSQELHKDISLTKYTP